MRQELQCWEENVRDQKVHKVYKSIIIVLVHNMLIAISFALLVYITCMHADGHFPCFTRRRRK
jgi:hypothetical protein